MGFLFLGKRKQLIFLFFWQTRNPIEVWHWQEVSNSKSHRYHEALGTTKPNPWIMLVAILKTSEIILNAEFICDRLLST